MHGIVMLDRQMDANFRYVEFKVNFEPIDNRSSNVIFIGLLNQRDYTKEMLSSSFWKDCPSSNYWDVCKGKLFKINEKGQSAGSIEGYGCQMDCYNQNNENGFILGIGYNFVERSVNFYMNGVDYGTAFTDIPCGLTPALDLWFHYGTVEIERSERFVQNNHL